MKNLAETFIFRSIILIWMRHYGSKSTIGVWMAEYLSEERSQNTLHVLDVGIPCPWAGSGAAKAMSGVRIAECLAGAGAGRICWGTAI